jgi:hypothetical protein
MYCTDNFDSGYSPSIVFESSHPPTPQAFSLSYLSRAGAVLRYILAGVCIQRWEGSLFTLHKYLYTWPKQYIRVHAGCIARVSIAAYVLLETVH